MPARGVLSPLLLLLLLLTAQAQQESLTQSQLLQQRVQDVFGAGAAGNSAEAGASGPGEVTLENDEMLLGRVSEMERELRKQLAEQERAGGQLTGLPQSTVVSEPTDLPKSTGLQESPELPTGLLNVTGLPQASGLQQSLESLATGASESRQESGLIQGSASGLPATSPDSTAAATSTASSASAMSTASSAGGNGLVSEIQSLEQEAKQLAADVAQSRVDRQVAQQRAQQLLQRLTEAEARLRGQPAAPVAASSTNSISSSTTTTTSTGTSGISSSSNSSRTSSSLESLGLDPMGSLLQEALSSPASLPSPLSRSSMSELHLNIGALYSPHLDSLNCSNAPTCPDFSGRCSVNPEISACFNPGLEDDGKQWLRAPENCPKVKNVVENGAEGFDVRCSHESDFAWHKWMVFQTFLLRGVYVSAQGQVFNESTHFARKGCGHFSEFSYPQSTPVRHMHRALSLVYPQATGFYHGLIEWLPQFLLLASLLQKLPNIAVLGTPEQWAFYDRVLKPLVGVELAQINRVDVKPNELILVDQLFMPLYQCCGKPSPAIWRDMRLRALLPPHGLPFFHKHGWQSRGIQPITETQAAAVLRSDWLVVVARRPGSRRVLDKFEELLEEVKKVFGQEKVRTFDGSLPILEAERMAVSKAASSTATETACYCSFPPPFLPIPHNLSSPSLSPSPALPFSPSPYTARSLFLQARLFIAGHGAALAKMVFMPLVPFQGPSSSSIPHNPLASLPFSSPAHSLPPPPVPSRHSDSNPHSRPINRPRRPSLTIPSSDDSFPPRPSPGGGRAGGGYGAAGYGAGHGAGHGGGYGGGYGGASLGEYGYPGNNDDNVRHDANLPTPVEFSYEELVAATDGFSAVNVLGEGGYGKVYRGVVREEAPDGSTEERHVAVKQLNDEGRQGFNEWLTEVVFLRRLRHPHLVQFVGYCTDQQQALLVYELMANASLDYHLFDGQLSYLTTTSVCRPDTRHLRDTCTPPRSLSPLCQAPDPLSHGNSGHPPPSHMAAAGQHTRPPLTWQQRVNVALGAAKGLAYLHDRTGDSLNLRDTRTPLQSLARPSLPGSRPPLTWQQRVNVALGAAKGLAYLHEGTERQVIFRDLKAANILLDENFNAKLSDFGLAKDGPAGENTHVSTMVVGTYGYTAPEYLQTGHLTAKSDVYAFGVVLLELLCGRRAVDVGRPGDEKNLVFWAKPFLADRKRIGEIVDPRLQGRFSHKGALKLAVAAHCCLQDAKSRPSMADMVQTLTALMEMGEGAGGGSGRGGDTPRTPRTPRTPKTAKTPKTLITTNTLKPMGSAGGDADTPAASRTPSAVSGDGANSARAHTGVGGDAAGVGGGDAGIDTVTGSDGGSSGGAVAPADGGLTAASYDAKSLHRVQVVANGGTVVPGLVETLGG
ncbi:unnamed protein product [Closterium sp. NIES-64]|nr:unnamed protein product [Closterium sp. NIES-64]